MKHLTILSILLLTPMIVFAQQNDWSTVENVFGKKGTVQGDVFKITFPRSDLKVKVGDFTVSPGLALTTWAGFIKMGDQTTVMGDLVLLDDEVPKAISKLVEENLSIMAIHNHLIGETPAVKYIHFSGKGDAVKLAEEIKAVIAVTATPLTMPVASESSNIDWSKVLAILGTTGKTNGNLLQYSFPRNEKLTESGMEMPAPMGMAIAINFQMDGNLAGVAGDFVLIADEVNPVIKALTENGILVTAVHNHMLNDNPRLFMMHFWAVGDPEKLATGLKAALSKTNVQQ